MENGKANTQLITFSRALQCRKMSLMLWDAESNYFQTGGENIIETEFANSPNRVYSIIYFNTDDSLFVFFPLSQKHIYNDNDLM